MGAAGMGGLGQWGQGWDCNSAKSIWDNDSNQRIELLFPESECKANINHFAQAYCLMQIIIIIQVTKSFNLSSEVLGILLNINYYINFPCYSIFFFSLG